MDPLTQIALGSAIGTVTLGRKVGARKAAIAGGIIAELPDLDILIPSGNVVDAFVDHRGLTHSLLMHVVAMPVFGEALRYLDQRLRGERWLCYGAAFAFLSTHALLDGFTTYGTRLLWPLFNTPISWSNIFIIDPLYTLPLLVALFFSLAAKAPDYRAPLARRTRRVASGALILSTAYMMLTLMAMDIARGKVMDSLAARGARYERVTVMPMPFNPLVWRGLAVDDARYYNVYVSLLDEGAAPLNEHPRNIGLIAALDGNESLAKIEWFSRGFFTVREENGVIYAADLRIGVEPNYVLDFEIARRNSEILVAMPPARRPALRDWSGVSWIWRRTFDETLARDE